MEKAFIEEQFPVSKISKESYKERKAGSGQTLTGLGKWWGRKPLVLVRAAIIGCLMPASDDPKKDNDIFLKIMSMDEDGLLLRKEKNLPIPVLYDTVCANRRLSAKYRDAFDIFSGKPVIKPGVDKEEIETAAFLSLGYDTKLTMCKRPEQVSVKNDRTWEEINHHLGTNAHSIEELVEQLSNRRFGHNARVGDCFCGGGSIPFEAARIGCDAYASDLNPIAGLLTWGSINILGADDEKATHIQSFLQQSYDAVDKEICNLGIEHNEVGDRALNYLYCTEAACPECGWKVPLMPSFIVSTKTKTVAELIEKDGDYDIIITSGVDDHRFAKANKLTTYKGAAMVCPHCGKTTPVSTLRHDLIGENGKTIYGLRKWGQREFAPRQDDVYQDRLYAIYYEHKELMPNGKVQTSRYYRTPNEHDLANEKKIHDIVTANIAEWQDAGFVPSMPIESGMETDRLTRERGWAYWHQLFNPRQLLILCLLAQQIHKAEAQEEKAAGLLGLNNCMNRSSKLSMWLPPVASVGQTFYNQALNTLVSYGAKSFAIMDNQWCYFSDPKKIKSITSIQLSDARDLNQNCDIWLTDPPYADAVQYHELTEFFIAWDKVLLKETFPDWYADSRRVLAVKGDNQFSQTMIEIYSNLTQHMSDNGLQIVMFTHSDPAVWAQLALIMWKAGLTVTAAWNIATETESGGLKDGNYVKGTVLLVLRKQQGDEMAFLDELTDDIKVEVQRQINSMRALDDKEDPNFSDPDYVLAAYAASLKVLTGYKSIGEINLDYELGLAINNPAKSQVVQLIERAKKIAYNILIPTGFDSAMWRDLNPAERFYIKGIENEKHGSYQVSTYQEYARGFGLVSYKQLMASVKANEARLKIPTDLAMRSCSDVPGFDGSILRTVLDAVYVAVKNDENPGMGFDHLKTTVPDYWSNRGMLKQLLSFIAECKDIDTMPHWKTCGEMAGFIYTLVDNDRIGFDAHDYSVFLKNN